MTEIDLVNKPKEYLENINPRGSVPTLVHNGTTVWESGIITQYVEDALLTGTEKSVLPSDPGMRAFMRIWITWFDENLSSLLFQMLKNPSTRETLKISGHEKLLKFTKEGFKHKGTFIIGDRPTLIDFHVTLSWKDLIWLEVSWLDSIGHLLRT
jgi:glutathione S-transferase